MSVTVGELFAGIAGFGLAAERAGCEVKWAVEIDPDCRRVYHHHFPDTPIHEDVRTAGKHNLTPVDVIVGGFPCQDLSVAGNRRGLGGQRSGLFWEMLRIADELKPSCLVWENVPGLLTTCSCRECGRRCAVCGTLAGAEDEECGSCGSAKLRGRVLPDHRGADFFTIVSALGFIGLDGAWTLLDAQWFGVPQRRQRLFGVFTQRHLGAERCVEILSFAARLSGHPPQGRKAGSGLTTGTAASLRHGGGNGRGFNLDAESGLAVVGQPETVGPLLGGHARGHRIGADEAAGGQRVAHLPDAEAVCLRVGGDFNNPTFSVDDKAFLAANPMSDRQMTVFVPAESVVNALSATGVGTCGADDNQAQAGHLIPPTSGALTTRQGKGPNTTLDDGALICVAGERTHALSSEGADASEDGTGRGTPIVTDGALNPWDSQGHRIFDALGASPALRGNSKNRNSAPIILPGDTTDPLALSLAENQRGELRTSETHPQLTTGGGKPGQGYPAIAFAQPVDLKNTKLGKRDVTGTLDTTRPTRGGGQGVMGSYGVRRLTPLEAERLQGFPDNWTAVDAEGKPISDSARYRMLGNSVAIPCVEWIMRRLVTVLSPGSTQESVS